MSIANKLLALKSIKNDIKSAIIAKGVEILDSTPFSSYADKVRSLVTLTDLGTKTINKNGTFNPSDDNLSGYSQVIVNVPTGMIVPKEIITRECIDNCYCYHEYFNGTQTNGTFQNGIYTGGSGAYLTLPSAIPISTANTWEFRTKYYLNGGQTNQRTIIGYIAESDCLTPLVFLNGNNFITLCVSSNGVSWDVVNVKQASSSLTNQKWYYIKIGFDGNNYYVDANQTGWDTSFSRYINVASTTKASSTVSPVLMNRYTSGGDATWYYSNGDIDLNETSITINGEVWWRGLKRDVIV